MPEYRHAHITLNMPMRDNAPLYARTSRSDRCGTPRDDERTQHFITKDAKDSHVRMPKIQRARCHEKMSRAR